MKIAVGTLDELLHLAGLALQSVLVKQAVDDKAVECIESAESESRIGSADVFRHLSHDADAGDNETGMDRLC